MDAKRIISFIEEELKCCQEERRKAQINWPEIPEKAIFHHGGEISCKALLLRIETLKELQSYCKSSER